MRIVSVLLTEGSVHAPSREESVSGMCRTPLTMCGAFKTVLHWTDLLPSPAACRTLTSQLHVPSFTEGSINQALVELVVVVVAMHGNFMLCLGFSNAARVRKRAVFSPAFVPSPRASLFCTSNVATLGAGSVSAGCVIVATVRHSQHSRRLCTRSIV